MGRRRRLYITCIFFFFTFLIKDLLNSSHETSKIVKKNRIKEQDLAIFGIIIIFSLLIFFSVN